MTDRQHEEYDSRRSGAPGTGDERTAPEPEDRPPPGSAAAPPPPPYPPGRREPIPGTGGRGDVFRDDAADGPGGTPPHAPGGWETIPGGFSPRPVRPSQPADRARAFAVGALNLSGLGIGYLLLRRWAGAVGCLAVTALFVYLFLPADPDGLPTAGVVAYVGFLLLAAADGFRRGLRTPVALPVRPVLAVLLGLALLAVPAGGAVAYESARKEAVERMLLDRLAGIDRTVEAASQKPFDAAEAQYTGALERYAALLEDHSGSRAAGLVPERLGEYYDAVSAPYRAQDHCGAVRPLTHLRTVPPEKFDADVLGGLDDRQDKPLAASLYACGVSRLGATSTSGGGELGVLLDTFPDSAEADRVRPAFEEAVKSRTAKFDLGEACSLTPELRLIDGVAAQLPQARVGGVDDLADRAVEDGAWACGLDHFADEKFAEAVTALNEFRKTYPKSSRKARAGQILIAAQIAEVRAEAGGKLPREKPPGGPRMEIALTNDGPQTVEVLYTGPVTGTLKIKGCSGCGSYSTESAGRATACKSSARDYGRKTLRLPAGEYHFLYRRTGAVDVRDHASGTRIEPNYSYTDCLFVVDDPYFGFLDPPLPDSTT
ncbi:hypothetical protein [Streptomyces sp. NPDC060194]|uniref:hypothetical protein n=1 Tax=Streptomyces sp. NPDC060194 TaxID=3347069 RepID=UPI00365372B9